MVKFALGFTIAVLACIALYVGCTLLWVGGAYWYTLSATPGAGR